MTIDAKDGQSATKPPPNPRAVLAAAIFLPGSGHLWSGEAIRALTFIFFMIVLGWVTSRVAPPEASFVGRHAGGFFVYAVSILDAYQMACRRLAAWQKSQNAPS